MLTSLPYLITSIGAFLLAASSFNTTSDLEMNDKHTEPWIETVIMNSEPRMHESSIDLYEGSFFVEEIDSSFFKDHLAGFETDFPRNWKIEFDPYSRYCFFDYQQYDSWISFTIFQRTDYGYDNFYAYTYDLTSKKVTSVSCIAQVGADGGAWNRDDLFFTDSGRKLTVSSQSYYDQDIDYDGGLDHCYTRAFDSIVSNFHFFPDRTDYSVDTLISRLDTICV